MDMKEPLPKYLVMFIMLIIFGVTVGGYVLFYQSQKRISQKDKEYEIIKEKVMHAEENYNDLLKKYAGASEELKLAKKEYETILQKNQECKSKQDELQSKYEELQITNVKIQSDLTQAQIKLGISEPLKPETTKSIGDHPIKQLNQSQENAKEKAKATEKAKEATKETAKEVSKETHEETSPGKATEKSVPQLDTKQKPTD